MDLIPRPTNLRGGVQKASKGGGSIAPEDAALDEMREVYVDVISPASTGVNLIVPVSDHMKPAKTRIRSNEAKTADPTFT